MKKMNEENNKKKMNKKGIIIIVITLIILVVIALVIIKVNIDKKNKLRENEIKEAQNNAGTESRIDFENLENAKLQDNLKVNTSEQAHNNKTFDGLEFSDMQLNSDNGETNFSVRITNISSNTIDEKYVKITCLNKEGSPIGDLYILVTKIEAGASINASAVTSEDYINLYDFKVEDVK